MLIFASDDFVLPLPAGHRFPMRKYARLRERVARVAPSSLQVAPAASDAELALAHDRAYIADVCSGELDARSLRRIGFPWSPAMVERSRRSVGATIAACRAALLTGAGASLAGGTHHAHRGYGEGFCVFNDVAVAIRALQAERAIERALIVDLDVHQGDGTAEILAGDRDAYTLSLHGRNNFPFRKRASRLDVELDDGTRDDCYLATLRVALAIALDASRPDLAVYLAGADPFEGDRLGRLALTKAGLAARDAFVLDTLRDAGVPVAIVMAGGYAADVEDVVDIHFETVRLALERFGAARASAASLQALADAPCTRT
jgi:acetoin utilization deacetylase AcuC-like enzyme